MTDHIKREGTIRKQDTILLAVLFGLISGAPAALFTSTSQAWLAHLSVDKWMIGLLSMLTIPYALKPLFAVLTDYYRQKNTHYITLIRWQGCLLACIMLLLTSIDPRYDEVSFMLTILTGCALSASIDVCIDGARVEIEDVNLQTVASTVYIIAYRLAVIFGSGLGLILADHYGWRTLFTLITSIFVVCLLCMSILAAHMPKSINPRKTVRHSILGHSKLLMDWFCQAGVWTVLLAVLMLKIHDFFVESMMQTYLIQHHHLGLSAVGVLHKSYGMAASILGGSLAGYAALRLSMSKLIVSAVVCKFISMMVFLLSVDIQQTLIWETIVLALSLEYFASGLTATITVILLTRLCTKAMAATQYAVLMSIIFAMRAAIGPFAAFCADASWHGYFIISACLLIAPCVFILGRFVNLEYQAHAATS